MTVVSTSPTNRAKISLGYACLQTLFRKETLVNLPGLFSHVITTKSTNIEQKFFIKHIFIYNMTCCIIVSVKRWKCLRQIQINNKYCTYIT